MATQLVHPESARVSQSDHRTRSPLFVWIFPALGVLSLLASCVLWSLKRRFWGDEVFSWIELRDPSLRHLLSAVARLGGGGMPLFYLTAWPWAHRFGCSDVSLRLYSSAGVCGAFLVLLFTLRRRVSGVAAFLGAAFGLFASLIVVEQNSEARGYGLYLLLAALAIAQLIRVAQIPKPGIRDLLLLALTQAGLVLGHVLGLLYAGLLLLALIATDAVQRRLRWRVYPWVIAGWLALLPLIPAIRASAAVGRPHGWIAAPTFGDLVSFLSFWLFTGLYWQWPHLPNAVILAGWLCAVIVMGLLILSALLYWPGSSDREKSLTLVAFALLAAPIVFYLVSIAITPIFLPRYMIPSALGVSLLAALWVERRSLGKGSALLLATAMLALPVATALLAHPQQLDIARVDALAAGRPVICESQKDFLVMTRYSADAAPPEYPVHWSAALAAAPATSADLRLIENYRREGYFPGQLPYAADVLSRQSFLILTSDPSWLRSVLANNPHFRWTTVAVIDPTRRLVLVTPQR
jgi:hypothetical protein